MLNIYLLFFALCIRLTELFSKLLSTIKSFSKTWFSSYRLIIRRLLKLDLRTGKILNDNHGNNSILTPRIFLIE